MINIFRDFFNLIYPKVCVICDESLVFNEKMFCIHCLSDFPLTKFISIYDNEMAQLFWGRVKTEGVYSLFYFKKNSKYRILLHKLKYKGEKEIGFELGRMLGEAIRPTEMGKADHIIPLPLHKKRMTERGYNQSEYIAMGVSEVLQIPVLNNLVKRRVYNITQTGKGRYERWENVKDIFTIKNAGILENKKIILLDDIITTGSTLEACATTITDHVDCRIYLCSLAYTKI